jgi:hypothetical protein
MTTINQPDQLVIENLCPMVFVDGTRCGAPYATCHHCTGCGDEVLALVVVNADGSTWNEALCHECLTGTLRDQDEDPDPAYLTFVVEVRDNV